MHATGKLDADGHLLPAGHDVHDVAPVLGVYVPLPQFEHDVIDPPADIVPIGQTMGSLYG